MPMKMMLFTERDGGIGISRFLSTSIENVMHLCFTPTHKARLGSDPFLVGRVLELQVVGSHFSPFTVKQGFEGPKRFLNPKEARRCRLDGESLNRASQWPCR